MRRHPQSEQRQKAMRSSIDVTLGLLSSTTSDIMRKSEIPAYFCEPWISSQIMEGLAPAPPQNLFGGDTATLPRFMEDLLQGLRMAGRKMDAFLQVTPCQVLYASPAGKLSSKEFHEAVDGLAPVALIIFLKTDLVIGATYTKKLYEGKSPAIKDPACGSFWLSGDEMGRTIERDHSVPYRKEGFQLGGAPTLFLNMDKVAESIFNVRAGAEREEKPDAKAEAVEGVVALQLA